MSLTNTRPLILSLTIAAAAVAGCTIGETPPAQPACTLIGCGPTMEIRLVGEHIPTTFSLTASTPDGKTVTVRCTDGSAEFDPAEAGRWSPACPAGGVMLQDFTPPRVSITLAWSEGEVTQDFDPQYMELRPNGPACDPLCRSAQLGFRVPDIPPYGDESSWETYSDEIHGFRLRFPAALPLELGPLVDDHGIVYFGDKIQLRTTASDPLVCQGECPMIESDEPVTLAGRDARLVRGYIGSIGGNIPQHFMLYRLRSGSTYISLALFAASRSAALGDPAVILPLQEADIELFTRIAQTLEFMP